MDKIRQNDPKGLAGLGQVFGHGVRFYLCRQFGRYGLDEQVDDTLLAVAQAIQRGELLEPEGLAQLVRMVARRQAARIEKAALAAEPGAEGDALLQKNQEAAWEVLSAVTPADRDALMRFYLGEQSAERICRETGLTETKFRVLKSRAKARFEELSKR